MNKRKMILTVIGSIWVGAMTAGVIYAVKQTQFNLDTTLKILNHLDQERFDSEFVNIVNNIEQPPSEQ